ncbi:MAG TPA: IPT/TIG domain-containing protein [Drouetiella sp.]
MRPSVFVYFSIAFLLSQPLSLAETKTLASGSCTSKSTQIQQFTGKINLDNVDNSMPLTLTFQNNKFVWMRVFLSDAYGANIDMKAQPRGTMIVNENSFKGQNSAIVDMTGRMRGGTTVLLMRGAGMPGSSFNWTLTTVTGTKITKIEPSRVMSGGRVTLSGAGFSPDLKANKVLLTGRGGPKYMTVIDATPDSIKCEVPVMEDTSYTLTVTANGTTSNPVKLKIMGQPELARTQPECVRADQNFTIYGKNFSDVPSENEVTVGGEKAKVVGSGPEYINVTAPFQPDMQGGYYYNPPQKRPITVKVGPVSAKGNLDLFYGPYPW